MVGELLLLSAVEGTLPHVERAVAFAEVVERRSVGGPYGFAVFTAEGGEPLVLALAEQPDVACHRTLVVLAEMPQGAISICAASTKQYA